MRKLGMVLVLLLAPNVAWGVSWPFPDHQGVYVDTAPRSVEHGMLTETGVENFSTPSLLVAQAENRALPNSPDSENPAEEEADPEGAWTIGEIPLTTQSKANPPLKVRSAGQSSLNSYNFVGKVGGVSFEQVAIPDTGLAGKSIQLSYDQASPDGIRLVVEVDSVTYRPQIPDWLLVPIARFANSDFTAATSLFGDGPDTKNFYYIQYHPAFQDTLLGLRLFQADILLMNANHNRFLPKRNGQVVLGQGEDVPTQNTNDDKALIGLSRILGKKTFTSWVLTDTEAPSSFSIQTGTFQLRSVPYYYFWSRNEDSATQHQGNVDAFNNRVRAYNLQVTNHKNLVSHFNSLVNRFNANNASVPKSTLDGLRLKIGQGESKLVALEQELNRLDMDLKEGAVVNPVPALTNALKNQSDLLKEINPVVINAVKATAEYAAFFRYMKFNQPNTWKAFLASIDEVAIHPVVKTPTKMSRKNP